MSAPDFVLSLSRHGERTALVDDAGRRVTYAQLAERVEGLAATLGDRPRLVMVEVASTVPAVTAYLAALRGGHAVIVGKPGDADDAGEIFRTFRPSAVHRAGAEGFTIRDEADPPLAPGLAALFSTSGSTGSAKLVRLSADNLQANAESIATYLGIDANEIAPIVLPLSYSFGASILSSHLLRGACCVLTEHSVVDPEFATLFGRERCTSLSGVPYTWELIEQIGFLSKGWPHLRTLTQAGGKMPATRVSRLASWARDHDARLVVMYGATECTARMSYLPWEHVFDHPDSIGIAIPGGRFSLVDEDGRTLEGAGVQGELVYEGPNVMMGYATSREELGAPAG
ncbi:MAG TPA: AMP-binding protein, partial [Myxococcota bacterium]|nr:AMP-binding protein [Myxococcota bacterium]